MTTSIIVTSAPGLSVRPPEAVAAAGGAGTNPPIEIIPNVLWLTWQLGADGHSVTLAVILLGLQIDSLTGSYDWQAGTASLKDTLSFDVLGFHILDGDLEVDVDETGIKLSGDLSFLGRPVGALNGGYIIKWP